MIGKKKYYNGNRVGQGDIYWHSHGKGNGEDILIDTVTVTFAMINGLTHEHARKKFKNNSRGHCHAHEHGHSYCYGHCHAHSHEHGQGHGTKTSWSRHENIMVTARKHWKVVN